MKGGAMAENRPFLDFKEIKQRVTISDVLPRYQVNLVRVNQTALKGTCPLPSHSSGSKNTFFVNVAKSVWYCHSDSCKKNGNRAGGNVIDFVAAMEQCSAYAAAKRIDEMFPTGSCGMAKGKRRLSPFSAPGTRAACAGTGAMLSYNERRRRPAAHNMRGSAILGRLASRRWLARRSGGAAGRCA